MRENLNGVTTALLQNHKRLSKFNENILISFPFGRIERNEDGNKCFQDCTLIGWNPARINDGIFFFFFFFFFFLFLFSFLFFFFFFLHSFFSPRPTCRHQILEELQRVDFIFPISLLAIFENNWNHSLKKKGNFE